MRPSISGLSPHQRWRPRQPANIEFRFVIDINKHGFDVVETAGVRRIPSGRGHFTAENEVGTSN